MLKIIKYTAVANIPTENGVVLHRELDFVEESEIDRFIAGSPDPYEKIPVWGESHEPDLPAINPNPYN